MFFNNLLLALDHWFCHRARGAEGKDGNPLNEVRVLCNSLTDHGGVMTPEKSIRLDPARSLLKLADGDTIALSAADFTLLASAFLAEVESRYP